MTKNTSVDDVRLLPWAAWWPTLCVLVADGGTLSSTEVSRRLSLATGGRTGRQHGHTLKTLETLTRKGLCVMVVDDAKAERRDHRGGYHWRATPDGCAVAFDALRHFTKVAGSFGEAVMASANATQACVTCGAVGCSRPACFVSQTIGTAPLVGTIGVGVTRG